MTESPPPPQDDALLSQDGIDSLWIIFRHAMRIECAARIMSTDRNIEESIRAAQDCPHIRDVENQHATAFSYQGRKLPFLTLQYSGTLDLAKEKRVFEGLGFVVCFKRKHNDGETGIPITDRPEEAVDKSVLYLQIKQKDAAQTVAKLVEGVVWLGRRGERELRGALRHWKMNNLLGTIDQRLGWLERVFDEKKYRHGGAQIGG